jgi:FkbM family methyltransferase
MNNFFKKNTPIIIRNTIRSFQYYFERNMLWIVILWQVRGITWNDQYILIKSAMLAPIYSMKKLLEWKDPVLLGDITVQVKGIGKFHLRAKCDDLYHVVPLREMGIVNILRNYLKPGDTFIDAGANIGFYTVLASSLVGESGIVISVEMMPDTTIALRRNLSLNNIDNSIVIESALSNQSGQQISARVVPGYFGQASTQLNMHLSNYKEVYVKSTTLDDVLQDIPSISLMKMDLEGSEFQAIKGAGDSLNKIQMIVFEQIKNFEDATPLINELKRLGYEISSIDGRNKLAIKL